MTVSKPWAIISAPIKKERKKTEEAWRIREEGHWLNLLNLMSEKISQFYFSCLRNDHPVKNNVYLKCYQEYW